MFCEDIVSSQMAHIIWMHRYYILHLKGVFPLGRETNQSLVIYVLNNYV